MTVVKDQYYNPTVDGDFKLHYDANANKGGVQFTPTVTNSIGQIDLKLYKTGSPSGNIWIEIWSDNGSDLPNAKISGSSDVKATTAITETGSPGGTYSFTWSSNVPSLTATTKYWIVVNADYANSTSNYIRVEVKLSDATRVTAAFDGATWTNPSYSYWFNEYYSVPVVTTPSGYSHFM